MFNKNFAHHSHINRNVVHPSIALDPVQFGQNTTVEIVELNDSSDDSEEKNIANNFVHEAELHPWSYISQELNTDEDSYRINKRARERRRLNKELPDVMTNGAGRPVRSPGHNYPSFYSFDRDYINDNDYKSYASRQVNCFTIPNNLGTSSTSSDDPSGDLDRVQCGDAILNEDCCYNTKDYDEVYFSQDLETDKRTIWIYSFKNKRILSENYYALTNIRSKDSSSGTSSSDELEPIKESQNNRLATPIPFIPRLNLNLASILPTVTEVTEPTKHLSTVVINSPSDHATRIISSDRSAVENNLTDDVPKNKLINWKSLSPRIKIKFNKKSDRAAENTSCESKITVANKENSKKTENIQHVDVESYRNVDIENTKDTLVLQKPHINVYPKPLTKDSAISDPIEKLEGNWIDESSSITKQSDSPITYELDLPSQDIDTFPANATIHQEVANTFFINNVPLLKPAEWREYMPITDSVPSLELSIITNVDTKKSWFMKLFKCVQCLKKD